jgi:putative hydrolase of the HAD superfamily
VAVRGVIFDYGGVIWDMRWDIARDLALAHGLRESAIIEALYRNDLWAALEVGVGERAAWIAATQVELDRQGGSDMPPLHLQWQEQQHLVPSTVELLRRLRPRYKTQLLSNADMMLREKLRAFEVHDLFDDVVISAEVRLAKPDAAIYSLALDRLGLRPEECVFIDDLLPNVDAARTLGMAGIHFRIDQDHDLRAMLADVGVATPAD